MSIGVWNNWHTVGVGIHLRGSRFVLIVARRTEPFFEGCFNWYFYLTLRRPSYLQPPYFEWRKYLRHTQRTGHKV